MLEQQDSGKVLVLHQDPHVFTHHQVEFCIGGNILHTDRGNAFEQEFEGADLSIHKIGATPEREVSW